MKSSLVILVTLAAATVFARPVAVVHDGTDAQYVLFMVGIDE